MTEAAAGEDGRATNVVVRPLMKDYIGESPTPSWLRSPIISGCLIHSLWDLNCVHQLPSH